MKARIGTLLLASSMFVMPAAALAQVAPAEEAPGATQGLEDIVVTARRQSESLLNVPVAVSAISRDTLERARVNDLQNIAELAPNVMIASTNNGAAISVRGVGTAGFDPGFDQSVAINIDGVTVGRGKIVGASQFDIQQVEILKGPQALFFGKNSPAGVVSLTSAGPTAEFSGQVRAGYETEAEERYAEAFVSGPISDTLGFRVAGRYSKMSGWIKNNALSSGTNLAFPAFQIPGKSFKATPQDEAYAIRGTLKWAPTDQFTADLKFTYGRLNSNNDSQSEGYCGGAQAATGHMSITSLGLVFAGLPGVVFDPASDCKLNQKTSVGLLPTELTANWDAAQKKGGKYWNAQDTYLGNLTMNYEPTEDLTLTSVTGYAKLYNRGLQNIDRTSFAVIVSAPAERARTWSQELRLASSFDGPLNFVTGGYFEDAKRSNKFQPILGFVGFDPANGGSAYTFENIWHTKSKTYSAFGQLKWAIVEQVELSGGVRYSKETKTGTGVNLYLNQLAIAAFGLAPVGQVVRKKNSFSNWSPEITLRYKPASNLTTYVAYKTGFKAGGLSTAATISRVYVANPDLLAFRPEKSKGFEAGFKGELFDRTVRFDVTAYRYNFTDLQLSTFNPNIVTYFVNNAGKSRTTGVESSVAWKATPELTLNGNASYTDAKFLTFQNAQCYTDIVGTAACTPSGYDRSGQVLPRSPKWVLTGGFDYSREVGENLKIGFGGNATFNSDFQTSELGNPAGVVDSFWRFDASIRVGAADGKWELALLGRNLTNEYYPVVTSDATLAPAGNYGAYMLRPRQIAIQGTMKF